MSKPCPLCANPPLTWRRRRTQLCQCGAELHYHSLGHPHGFTGFTPGCPGFREPAAAPAVPQDEAFQLPMFAEVAHG